MNKFFQSTKNFLQDKLLLKKIPQWFQVSDEQMAEILETVREKLPTTEAILIGKNQSGKSSIVRGLTGVSAEIVGQGFRPHTKHTNQYTYPNDDLPLLIFTDTVGLGEAQKNTDSIIQELTDKLQASNHQARVVILTVKINDFATETLAQVAQNLRQLSPKIPYLLVVTCLHEIYPSQSDDHPAYPPNVEDINRAFNQLKEDFQGLYDDAILIDFTLEEDGYTPVFYGLETLRDSIAKQLPEAESVAIHQLLEGETSEKIGNLYRDVARRYIWAFSVAAATLAAVPLPFATMPVLTTLQVSQITLLGKLYGQILTPSQAGGIVSAIAGGFLAQSIGRELIKFIPGLGSIIAASWAGAYTWALGEGACVYFGDLMGGKKPNPAQIQTVMQEAFKQAQNRFKRS
ncbi:YcjF family protein [Crocosphaera watsonii]|uniref:YcjF family protein n=1 Tax=Crocosphaera watsonii TaxID=263511 RepID=UPI000650AC69|nr:GTPase [Crocosphaera watsonii]